MHEHCHIDSVLIDIENSFIDDVLLHPLQAHHDYVTGTHTEDGLRGELISWNQLGESCRLFSFLKKKKKNLLAVLSK